MDTTPRAAILDGRTGELFLIDPQGSRIRRLQKRVHAWAAAIKPHSQNKRQTRMVMITLTYRGKDDWRPNHIAAFTKRLRRQLRDGLLALAWVGELQERGAVHFHAILLVKRGTRIELPDKRNWPHGCTKIETVRNPFYIMKYASKARFRSEVGWHDFPKGMRLFHVWISQTLLNEIERFYFKLSALPEWLKTLVFDLGVMVVIKRADGGGWYIIQNAEEPVKVRSPYRFLGMVEN